MITGGDYLFDPASGSRYSKDDDHIAQIIELLGEIPKSIAFSGKYSYEFFNRKGSSVSYYSFSSSSILQPTGELRHISKLRYWPLTSVLHDKYLFPKDEAEAIAAFLTPMLHVDPQKRPTAAELAHHNWLKGIVIQGENDLNKQMEGYEPAERKAVEDPRQQEEKYLSRAPTSRSRVWDREDLGQSARDGLMPIDEGVSGGEDTEGGEAE